MGTLVVPLGYGMQRTPTGDIECDKHGKERIDIALDCAELRSLIRKSVPIQIGIFPGVAPQRCKEFAGINLGEVMERYLIQHGLDSESCVRAPDDAVWGTRGEVRCAIQYLFSGDDKDTLVLVTSGFHALRTHLACIECLGWNRYRQLRCTGKLIVKGIPGGDLHGHLIEPVKLLVTLGLMALSWCGLLPEQLKH
jgi:hypothetical protein